MNLKRLYPMYALLLAGTLFSAAGCKKDDDDSTAQETITTVVLTVTGSNGFNQSYEWNDLDGAGGNDPVIDNLLLSANATYNVSVRFEDRSRTPVGNLTPEIQAEGAKHLLTFTPNASNVTVSYADQDANGNPLGLNTTWATGATSFGTITVRLHHEPTDKNNTANPGGETDVEATFALRIQ